MEPSRGPHVTQPRPRVPVNSSRGRDIPPRHPHSRQHSVELGVPSPPVTDEQLGPGHVRNVPGVTCQRMKLERLDCTTEPTPRALHFSASGYTARRRQCNRQTAKGLWRICPGSITTVEHASLTKTRRHMLDKRLLNEHIWHHFFQIFFFHCASKEGFFFFLNMF